jgi:hypothetical protein
MRIYECSYIDILDGSKNVSMSGGYIYYDINEFVSDLIKFINDYIEDSWIPQTNYRQLPRGVYNITKKYSSFGEKQHIYNNTSELIDVCLYLKRSKYIYLDVDRTRGIVIHATEMLK